MFCLKVAPLGEANGLLAAGWPIHCVSLLDQGTRLAHRGQNHLVLEFGDVGPKARRGTSVPPAAADVAAVLGFTAGLQDGDRLLVHCIGGYGRSPAVAVGILVQHGQSVASAWAEVRRQRPQCAPNRLLIALFDAAIGMGGALSGKAASGGARDHDRRTPGGLLLPPALVRSSGPAGNGR